MTGADLRIMRWVAQHRFAAGNGFAGHVMALTNDRFAWLLVAIVSGAYVIVSRRLRFAVVVVGAVAAAYVASFVLKDLFQIARPLPSLELVYVDGWSFPSTDAAITAAAASAAFFGVTWVSGQVRRRLAWTLGGLVGIVGLLLVYVGAHWPTDVLAGWVLGGAVGVGVAHLGRRIRSG